MVDLSNPETVILLRKVIAVLREEADEPFERQDGTRTTTHAFALELEKYLDG